MKAAEHFAAGAGASPQIGGRMATSEAFPIWPCRKKSGFDRMENCPGVFRFSRILLISVLFSAKRNSASLQRRRGFRGVPPDKQIFRQRLKIASAYALALLATTLGAAVCPSFLFRFSAEKRVVQRQKSQLPVCSVILFSLVMYVNQGLVNYFIEGIQQIFCRPLWPSP